LIAGSRSNYAPAARKIEIMPTDHFRSSCRVGRSLLIAIAIVSMTSGAATAQVVVDGNHIMWADRLVRLWGIDAPDEDQICGDGWQAGRNAKQFLAQSMQDGILQCADRSQNPAGQTHAVCQVDSVDLGTTMVRAGMAWADLGVTHKYVVDEAKASASRLGVHGHRCVTAWTWRTKKRVEPQFNRQ